MQGNRSNDENFGSQEYKEKQKSLPVKLDSKKHDKV